VNTFEESYNNVVDWANQKNLILHSADQIKAQLGKMREEFNELQEAIDEYLEIDFNFDAQTPEYAIALCNALEAVDLEMGDVFVTAIVTGACIGTDPMTALDKAYNKIKNRTGKVVNGQFVKD